MNNKMNENNFFTNNNWNKTSCQNLVTKILDGFDDGELYLQESYSENLVFDDRKVHNSSFDITKGFGLRGVLGEVASYAHATDFSEQALKKAGEVVSSIKKLAKPVHFDLEHSNIKHDLYPSINPIEEFSFQEKIEIAKMIDEYIRSKNSFVKQVTVRISGSRSLVQIIKAHNESCFDIRPMVQLVISVTLEKDGKLESSGEGRGYRGGYKTLFTTKNWQIMADDIIETAMIKLGASPSPAGEYTIVLGAGNPGVLLHEAVGHGLEGDFNRKKTSAFSEMMGKQVASKGVTIIDDGTIPGHRGSINFDDEGTPTAKNTLIKDGILVGYMQDRMNARLMKSKPTGNGRRQSYAHQPMPRMTNTYMLSGNASQADMISSIKNGVFLPKFTGGQVDITSGKFVFNANLAYLIEDGKITSPIKGATLIGSGPDVMKKIRAIGDDMCLDKGTGVCGKEGQSVPVGLGQPSLLIDKVTIGGTKL
jgi:TldD protein